MHMKNSTGYGGGGKKKTHTINQATVEQVCVFITYLNIKIFYIN